LGEDLFQPTLEEGYEPTKSFNFRYIYILAFFGGIIPVIVICGKNAKWLKISKGKIYALAALSVAVLIAKLVLIAMFFSGTLPIADNVIRNLYRIACIGMVGLYFLAMKEPYSRHRLAGLPFAPLKAYAIGCLIAGIVVEAALTMPIAYYFSS
jgi:glucan phosphoethanolaminetransferase (alkaline phosphatase superfamily)